MLHAAYDYCFSTTPHGYYEVLMIHYYADTTDDRRLLLRRSHS